MQNYLIWIIALQTRLLNLVLEETHMAKRSSGFTQTIVRGTKNDDTLEGAVGVAERLVGSGCNDTLIGEWGDIANTPSGYLIYDGGIGIDTLDFTQFHDPVSDKGIAIDLYQGYIYRDWTTLNFGDLYDPQFATRLKGAVLGVENVIGSDFDDYIKGNHAVNYIGGRAGNDHLSTRLGTNTLIGGADDDHIHMSAEVGTLTGDGGGIENGNDIFYLGGGYADIYSMNRITDFDLRDSAEDTQFDKLYLTSSNALTWGENEAGELVAYMTYQNSTDVLGEIVFTGLTLDDLDSMALYSIDYYNGATVTPISVPAEWP